MYSKAKEICTIFVNQLCMLMHFIFQCYQKTIPKNLMTSFRGDVCRAEMDTKFLRAPPGY